MRRTPEPKNNKLITGRVISKAVFYNVKAPTGGLFKRSYLSERELEIVT